MPYDPGPAKQGEQGQDTDGLLKALKAEEQWAASYLKSELQEAQINALKRYYGDEYGDEVEGRSRVTTREVYEIIQWMRPDLRRTFTSGDRVCQFEGVTPESDQHADDASDYINHIFLADNDGEKVLDEIIFDGLLQRVGVIAAEWADHEWSAAQEVSGLNTLQMQALMQDPRTKIVEQDVRQDAPDPAHPDGLFYDLKIKQRTKDAKPEVFSIAPEDFRVAARTVDLETTRYAGDVVRMMRGEAKLKWPDYAEEIDAHQGDTGGFNTDERRAERFRDLEGWDAGAMRESAEGEATEIEIMREYIRFDLDGDGHPELIRCYRLGDCLLEHDEVDEHIYSYWTPNPIPHRFYGLGVADEASDIQRTKTVLLRSMLDATYQSVVPRMYANTKIIGERGLDALLTVRPGVVIEGEGPASEALLPIQVPDLGRTAIGAMQWMDQVLDSRTGVTRQAQGFDPDLLHDTAKGVELLQNAASVRKEEVARNLAVGLQSFFMKLYRLVHKHQNEARAVKIAGNWRNVDPRAWEAQVRCTVSVGLGTGAREKQFAMLQMLSADMAAAYQVFGPGNPSVGPEQFYAMFEEKGRVFGFKSIDKFCKPPVNPDGTPWVPQPPPSPDQQKVQAQIQEGQARLQMDGQKAMQDAQIRRFETEAKSASDAQKAQLDAQIAAMKAEGELTIMREKMQLEMQMKREQMAFEANMKMQQFAFEKEMAEREFEVKAETMRKQADAKVAASGGVSDTKFGGDPG